MKLDFNNTKYMCNKRFILKQCHVRDFVNDAANNGFVVKKMSFNKSGSLAVTFKVNLY